MSDFVTAFFNDLGDGNKPRLGCNIEAKMADRRIASVSEFIKAAGRDYRIQPSQAYVDILGEKRPVPGQFHLVRSSDNAVVSPHTVTGHYDPLCLTDIAEDLEPFASQGWATPDGVYSVREGQLEVLSLRLDAGELGSPTPSDGADLLHYLVVTNPHGTAKAQGKLITFRIVCANTFAAAVSAGFDFKVSHKVRDGVQGVTASRFEYAVKSWERLKTHVSLLAERINRFISLAIPVDKASRLTDALLGVEDGSSTRRKNMKDEILGRFNSSKAGTSGKTAWDWLNAVTSFTSNGSDDSTVDPLARLTRNIESTGSGYALEAKAVQLVEALV